MDTINAAALSRATLVLFFVLLQLSLVVHHQASGKDADESLEYENSKVWWSDEEGRSLSSSAFPANVSCLICNVAAADVQYGSDNASDPLAVDEFLGCMTESSQEPDGLSNQVYALDQLPKAFVRQYKKQLYSGNARICIHQGHINRQKHQIVIPNNTSAIQLLPGMNRRRRRLYPTMGQNVTVLVVRVTSTAGEDPGLTASELEGSVFGTGPFARNATLLSQYAACSQGKWMLVPASGNSIVNGVLDVQYMGQVAGGDITGQLQSSINQLVLQSVGVQQLSDAANHIFFCLPTGSVIPTNNSKWLAFSYLNKTVSFFQQGWCEWLSPQVHEMGHQIGFKHSGLGIYEYNDKSCMMGGSSNQSAAPLECFNGHKNWLSGWFDDRKVSVDPIGSGAWVGNLVAFVDYPSIDQIPNGVTVINAGYLYIQLNSAKKYNYQVAGYGNQVTVVENNATAPWSNILVGLSAGKGYVYANYSGTGIGLVVQVCNIAFGSVDYAKVSLYLKDGVQTSQCSSPVNPVPSITPLSTPPPSFQLLPTMPTPLPSPSPTSKPTLMPASSPTRQPFAPLFTSPPTPLPTPPPSHAITRSPTMTPTRLLTPPSEPPFSSNTSPLVSISSSPALPTRRPTRQPHARVRLPTKPRTRRRPPTTPPTAS